MRDIISKNQTKKINRRLLGSGRAKWGKFARMARIVFSLAVIGALVLNSARFGFTPQRSAEAATTVFTETFSTTTYRDAGATTANWDTAAGNIKDRTYTSLEWGKMDLTSGTDNISNTSGGSAAVQFAFDSNNRPYVVWNDATTGSDEIYFSKWSGSAWVKADGTAGYDNISNNADSSFSPQIILDSTDKPYITWIDDTVYSGNVYFTKWSGTAWVKANGTAGFDNISNLTSDGGYTSNLKILLDSSNNPYLAWDTDLTGFNVESNVYFTKWSGSAWVKADGSAGKDNVSNISDIELLSDFKIYSNNPYILWWDASLQRMLFSKWNGTNWTRADGSTLGYDVVSGAGTTWGGVFRIVGGNPYVTWVEFDGSDDEIYFSKWSGTAWVKANGSVGFDNVSNNSGSGGDYPQLQLDSSNNPIIVWNDSTTGNYEIYFSKWSGTAWVKADGTAGYDNISNNAGISGEPQIQLDSSNNPYIIWSDSTTGVNDIYFSKWNGTNWVTADGVTLGSYNISNNAGDSYTAQIQIDSTDRSQVIWSDSTGGNYEIYSKKWNTGAYYSGSTAQSLKINGAITNITKATLTATQTLNGQTVTYEMTNDGGTSWNSVTSGVEYTFSAAANDLRWRATISTTNDTLTPVIDTVAISYVNNNAPNAPTLSSPANSATEVSLTAALAISTTDPDSDDVQYKIEIALNAGFSSGLQTFDQSSSQTGWSGQDSGGGTRYTSGTQGTYTIQTALTACTTYYWRSYAIDPTGSNGWSSASSSNTFITTGCNTAPSATAPNTIFQSTDGLGRISFQTAISDSDSNNTKLKVEYSDDNGTTWYDAQLASVSVSAGTVDLTNSNAYQIGTSDAIDTSTGSKTLTIVWDAKSSFNGNGALTGDQSDIKVRVTPNDSTADGTAQASSAFEVDNRNPSGLGSLSFSGVTTDQIAASWSQATEANFQRYRLYYGTSQSDVENQTSSYYQSTSISTAQTTVTSLTSAATYYFKLFATDIYGNSSSTSTASQATLTPSVVIPPPPVPPPAPEPAPEPEVPPEEEPEEKPKPSAPLVTSISEGETVNQNTFTLSGVAPADSIVIMLLDNRSITQTTTNSSGTFTFFLFNLTDGSHTLRLQTKDADGNVSDASYFTFNVDVPRELEKTADEQRIYPEAAPAEVPPTGGEIPGVSGEAGGPSIPITPSPVEEVKGDITPSREERLLPQVVQTITKTITEAPKAVIKTVAKIQEIIPKPHQKWEEQTPIEKTVNVAAQTVVTAGAATGVALSTGLVTLNVGRLAVTFADINLMLIRAFTTLLSVAGIRRKKSKPWGTVYDSQTKQPLDPAYVQLLDDKGNELETQITDLEGRFGFFVKQSGIYSLFANKTNYKFPSERLKGKSGDELYDNLYFGIPLSLQEGQILNISVPMDSEKFDWNEFAKKEQGYVKVNPRTEILKRRLSKYAFYSGLVFTPVSYLFSPSKFNLFIVGIYFLIFVLRMFNVKEKQYGMAYNKRTNQPLSFAVVRAVYPGIDKPVKSVVADKFGRYYLIVPNGKYYLRVEQKNPDGSYALIHQTAPFDVKKGIITSDVEA